MEQRERIFMGHGAATPRPARPEPRDDELGDDELDHVAGGLARAWLERDGAPAAPPAAG